MPDGRFLAYTSTESDRPEDEDGIDRLGQGCDDQPWKLAAQLGRHLGVFRLA